MTWSCAGTVSIGPPPTRLDSMRCVQPALDFDLDSLRVEEPALLNLALFLSLHLL